MVSSTVLAVQDLRSRKAEMEAVVHTNCLFERTELHDLGIGKIRKKKKQACPQAKKTNETDIGGGGILPS